MAKLDRRNLRRKKADFKKRFSQLTLQETLGIIVSIKNRSTKQVLSTSLVHSMRDAQSLLEKAELEQSDIYATYTSLSGDIRVSIASSNQFNQSFLDTSQTSIDSSDSKATSSNSEAITNDSDFQQQQNIQPDIITLDSDDDSHHETVIPTNKCEITDPNMNAILNEPIPSTSFAMSELGKSPITPSIAIRKAKRLTAASKSSNSSHNPCVKNSSNKKLTKQNKEKINELLQIIKQSKPH